jgi:NTE family protein
MSIFRRKKTTGIAFGGGATRGLAHIGVIKVFEEHNIKFDLVAGNSAGSIIGALYAAGFTSSQMYNIAKKISPTDILGLNFQRKGLFKSNKLEELLREHLNDKTFADLERPYRCVAVNLRNGELVELYEGSVVTAVRASCSVPGVFSPTVIDDLLLVDGGILNSVPADVVQSMGATFTVAVNLNSDRGQFSEPKTGFDVVYSSLKIAWNENTVQRLKNVNVAIAPDLKDFTYYDLKHIDKMIEIGEKAARDKISEILKGFK